MNNLLFYISGALALVWGIAHLFPTKSVVKGFGNISLDNKRIITMEWIIEGIALIFIGILIVVVTFINAISFMSIIIYWLVFGLLIVLATVSLATGFKVNFLPFKLCPVIFSVSALLLLLGMML